ncbi:uncharacterized protein LOC129804099 [Phlebotomus papatasi]|uniref:uncharacterized protein LOC129804099 n=1 Tax=Phlebotomus papatasi TaxID=29031 RepID=UPI002483D141|nr:uncharacterized protein LOC129804099 [Phlebotomus papatasi]
MVAIIIDNHLFHRLKITPSEFQQYTAAIKQMFPTEDERVYYCPRPKKCKANPKGKLYARYKNILSKYKGNLRNSEERIPSPSSPIVECDDISEIIMESVQWLHQNSEPWDDVVCKWKITSSWRIQEFKRDSDASLESFLNKWPICKNPEGFNLMMIDFETENPNVAVGESTSFETSFTRIVNRVLFIMTTDIKDKPSKQLLKKIYDPLTTEDSIDCILVLLLNALILPDREDGNKKPTIKDAQRDMILHVKTENQVSGAVEEVRKRHEQPIIVVIGSEITNLTKFQVHFKEISYEIPKFATCVEVILKISLFFRIKYPYRCKHAWEILQGYFIRTSNEVHNPKVQDILNRIN